MRYIVALLLLSCRASEPAAEVPALYVPPLDVTHVSNDEYEDNVPICERGPKCDEDLFYNYLDACELRTDAHSRQLCMNDERSHFEWCLTFHESFDAACNAMRPGDIPGPLALCERTCSDMAGAMNNYECATGSRDCIKHNHYWRLLCERSCPTVYVITTWGAGH